MSAEASADRPSQLFQDPIARRLAALEQLQALAERAATYLRRSALPAVRISAALLLAASLAACSRAEEVAREAPPPAAQVQPLTQEVMSGLPAPGRYAVQPDSVYRDQRGVYQFAWLERRADGSQVPHGADASRLRLAQSERAELEVPANGDPILYLPANAPVRLVEAGVAGAAPTPTSGGSSVYVAPSYPYWAHWFPFPGSVGSSRPTYYDPPRTVEPGQRVDGGIASTAPKPFSERVSGLSTAVSGRAGGTGSGSAVTNKSGAGRSAGVTAPKSGGFSSGRGSVGSSSSS